MTTAIQVILVTGFLGSGKTTFLNHVVRGLPADTRVAVLMNEFADIGVDAALITRLPNLDIIEVNKGSIFCICAKKDFLLGLAHIADMGPDILLIEATGVANPLDIKKDLKLNIFKNRFAFAGQICLVDTPNFEAAYHVYHAVEYQIASSDIFILNKMDLADAAQKRKAEALIAKGRQAPVFIEAVDAQVPFRTILEKMPPKPDPAQNSSDAARISPQAVDLAVAELARHPADTQTPADHLVADVYRWKGNHREQLQMLLDRLPSAILRIKGFVDMDGRTWLVSRAMGSSRIEPVASSASAIPPGLHNRMVCIAPPAAFDLAEDSCVAALLEKESRHDPVTIMDMMPGAGG